MLQHPRRHRGGAGRTRAQSRPAGPLSGIGPTTLLLCSTRDGVVRSEHDDGRWQVDRVLDGLEVNCLAADPLDPAIAYAGTQGNGLYRSGDRGRTWRPVGPPNGIVKAVTSSRHEHGLVWIGTKPARVIAARNGGERWEPLQPFPRWRSWFWMTPAERPARQPYVLGLAESPAEPGVLVAGIEAGALLLSEDGAHSWSGHRHGASRDTHSLLFHPHDGSWVYQGGGTGPAYSRDGGRTWTRPRDGLDRRYSWAVAADPAQAEIWYVSAAPGPGKAHGSANAEARIFRCTNDRWQPLAGGLPDPLPSMVYGLAAPLPGEVWAVLAVGEIWRSVDHGSSWERLPLDLGPLGRAFALLAPKSA